MCAQVCAGTGAVTADDQFCHGNQALELTWQVLYQLRPSAQPFATLLFHLFLKHFCTGSAHSVSLKR